MALLQPASTAPFPTGHRRTTGILVRRPSFYSHSHSSRRSRLHAHKPGSTGRRGTETPSGSESENVVLKAAWYGSEVLGIAASFFRPPRPAEEDAGDDVADSGASERGTSMGPAQVAQAIKDDFARSYFVTGPQSSNAGT